MSLRTRVWLVVGTLVAFPLLAAALVVSIYLPRALAGGLETQLRAAADAVANDLADRCRDVGLAARALAVESTGRPADEAIAAVLPTYGDYAAVLAPDAAVLAEAGGLPQAAEPPSQVPSCTTGVPEQAVLAERVAVSGEGGEVSSAVVADAVTPDELDRLARVYAPAARGAAVALVRDGEVLVASAQAEEGDGVLEAFRQAPEGGSADLEDRRAVVRPAGSALPWTVVVAADERRIGSRPAVLGAGLLTSLLALGLGLFVARSLTGPLSMATEAAERVAAGDFDQRLPVQAEDEVGRLSSSFNAITEELRRNMTALERSRDEMRESLERMGEALQSTHDIDGLLQVVLETAVASSGASAGVAMLIEGSTLTRVAEEGLQEHGLTAPTRLGLGAGTLGAVAASGNAARGTIGPGAAEATPSPDEPQAGSVLAVPLRRGARAIGVLAVYRFGEGAAGEHGFTDEHEDGLRTLANQAGIAVDNVRLHTEAERLSLTDPLTGLRNFRYLSMELAREIERATRFDRPLAVLMLDLDHFKPVNDTYGHARGDAVLRELAARLSEVIREVDTLARYGGEEFVLVLPETGVDGATKLAERVCTAVRRQPFGEPGEDPVPITVSVGVAAFPEHGASPATLMRTADEALYAAKHAGRDQWRVAGGQVADG